MSRHMPRFSHIFPNSLSYLCLLWVFALVFVFAPAVFSASPAAAVWVADGKLLKRIDTQTNRITLSLPLTEEPKALAVTLDGSVWVATEDSLLKFDPVGQPLGNVLLKNLAPSLKGKHLVLDPYDQSLWVGGEKTLAHLSATGQLLKTWQAPDEIKALSLDTDQTPWVLTKKQLLHLSVQTAVLHTKTIDTLLKDPKHLLIDGLAGLGWLIGEKALLQLDLRDLNKPPLAVAPPKDTELDALALHPLFGTLYAATDKALLLYDRAGQLVKTLDLAPFKLDDDLHLLVEPHTGSLWIGGKKLIVRMTSAGQVEASIALEKETEAMAAGPFHLLPTLSLLEPPENSLTKNPRPPFRLGLGAECNGAPCTLVDAYTQSFSLDATLNGLVIGNLFTLANREALYLPPTRLPEGTNLFSTQAKDVFGHLSNRITSQVTIDTIPPAFLSLTPADGSTLTAAAVTISGQVDDPTASVILKNAAGTVLNVGTATFSFSVALAAGLNTFTLTAQDPAGNATTISHRLTLSAVSVSITSPVMGASVGTSTVLVQGTHTGPANTGITVNGQVALTQGTQFFVTVPLAPGANTLTAQATTPEGATASHAVTVTRASTTPDPAEVRAEPLSGIAPLTVRFSVRNNSATAITRIEADFDGNGSIDFTTTDATAAIVNTYSTPGIYQPRITVIQGTTTFTQTLVVGVNDAQQMDQLFTTIWTGMNDALVRGEVTAALGYLNESAKRKYQRVFQVLLPQMPQIVASYSLLRRVSISENIGEYAINRTINGRNKIFLIYFLKDQNGVWRLDAM